MNTSSFTAYFKRLTQTLEKVEIKQLETVVNALMECREKGNCIYIFGNGGSAANASHITGDFLKGISYKLDKRFKVICLNDNMAGTTAITNDLSYDEVFVEQLKTFASPGDLVIGISGSGNSANVVNALEYARTKGIKSVAVCGYKGGKIIHIADMAIHVPVDDMEITEDIHTVVFHAIKQEIIYRIKGDSYTMGDEYDKRVKQ